jgi:hypothetical protein
LRKRKGEKQRREREKGKTEENRDKKEEIGQTVLKRMSTAPSKIATERKRSLNGSPDI